MDEVIETPRLAMLPPETDVSSVAVVEAELARFLLRRLRPPRCLRREGEPRLPEGDCAQSFSFSSPLAIEGEGEEWTGCLAARGAKAGALAERPP